MRRWIRVPLGFPLPVHAGLLKNYTAKEVLQDGEKLFQSLMEVNQLYKPFDSSVVFDLQVEAERLGCGLAWAEDTPPFCDVPSSGG